MARESKRKRDERRLGKPERIIDLFHPGKVAIPRWCESERGKPTFVSTVKAMAAEADRGLAVAKLIIADNVCEYLFAENPKEDWDYERDFPACVPPFEKTFIEFARPSRILSEGEVKTTKHFPERIGWILSRHSVEDVIAASKTEEGKAQTLATLTTQIASLEKVIDKEAIGLALTSDDPDKALDALGEREQTFLSLSVRRRHLVRGGEAQEGLPEDAAWSVKATLLIASNGVVAIPANCRFIVKRDGGIWGYPIFGLLGSSVSAEQETKLRDSWSSLFYPALLAVSFMNCKNVTLEVVEPDAQLNRQRRKEGEKPFLRYHTINIEPMKRTLRTEGNIETEGLRKALHICRGHFATYSDSFMGRTLEEPVTFWRPAHVRGSAKEGIIVSDYTVDAPKPPGEKP